MKVRGTFYGISLGPGDPELMTVKAVRMIEKIPVIAYPMTVTGTTLARDIASSMVDFSGKTEIVLRYSMEHDKEKQEEGHRRAAAEIRTWLEQGTDVAMLNLGDISVYSTYGYLRDILEKDGFETVMVPGVTSFCAVASRLGVSLTEHEEQLHIAADAADTESVTDLPGTKVLMKSGRKMPEVLEVLRKKGLLASSSMITDCGMEDEEIYRTLENYEKDRKADYFSTIVIREN